MLVRYFSGNYSEEPITYAPSVSVANVAAYQNGPAQPRSSTSSNDVGRRPVRRMSKDDIMISKGPAMPISQLPPDPNNAKLFQASSTMGDDYSSSSSPIKIEPSPTDRLPPAGFGDPQSARRILEHNQGQPSSLPDSSPLSGASPFPSDIMAGPFGKRANSELGHYPDHQDPRPAINGQSQRQQSPERHRTREAYNERKSFYPTLNTVASSPTTAVASDRVPSPDKLDANEKVKISGPINGTPIPSGFKFGGKDAPPPDAAAAAAVNEKNERREKAKSRSFWGFGKTNGKYHFILWHIQLT